MINIVHLTLIKIKLDEMINLIQIMRLTYYLEKNEINHQIDLVKIADRITFDWESL